MSRKPTATRDEVKEVFLELIEENGSTSSLEVKQELRKRGYWATQMEIGPLVRDIADEEEIDWTFNGNYRLYQNIQSTAIQSNTGLVPVNATPISKPKRNPIDPDDREPLSCPEDGCWECYEVSGTKQPFYFSKKLTAGQARYAYQMHTGVSYVDIRSKKYVA